MACVVDIDFATEALVVSSVDLLSTEQNEKLSQVLKGQRQEFEVNHFIWKYIARKDDSHVYFDFPTPTGYSTAI